MDAVAWIIQALAVGLLVPLLGLTLPLTIIRRLSRRSCVRCGKPARQPDTQGRCLFCRAVEEEEAAAGKPRARNIGITMFHAGCALAGILGILALATAAIGTLIRGNSVPAPVAYPAGFVVLIVYAIVLPRKLAGDGPGVLEPYFLNWIRELEGPDLRAARRAAGRPGRRHEGERAVCWTDWSGYDLDRTDDRIAAVAEEFSRTTGFDAGRGPRLRVLCFEEEAAFERYLRPIYPDMGRMGGCATGPYYRRLVVRAPDRFMAPSSFEHFLAHELTHAFLHHRLRAPSPWLDEGLATRVAGRIAPPTLAPGALYRRTEASRARGDLPQGPELLAMSAYRLLGYFRDDGNPRSYRRIRDFYDQSALLLDRMSAAPREALPRFLAGFARRRKAVPEWFKECFVATPDEMLTEARVATDAAPPGPPPDAIRDWLEAVIAPMIEDRNAPVQNRRLAARTMGSAGYLWKATALIDVLETPDDPIRPEAMCSLQDLSGGLRGADPASWREWLGSLPPESRCSA